jgi:hypothetical protein
MLVDIDALESNSMTFFFELGIGVSTLLLFFRLRERCLPATLGI